MIEKAKGFLGRLAQSAVVWLWVFNGLRLASGFLLLPLLVHKLAKPEFGMYYVFLSVVGLLPIIDFGFSASVGRFVSYAMAGAERVHAQGFTPPPGGSAGPNFLLLWQLLRTTRILYRWLALLGLVGMGTWGTVLVWAKAPETAYPSWTWMAWGVTLLAAVFDVYSTWWNTFLLGMNQVRESARIMVWAYCVRFVLACLLLMAGMGLLAVPAAALVGCVLGRVLSRQACLQALGPAPAAAADFSEASLLHLLWPNSWRVGLQALSLYLRTYANTAICAAVFGLVATYQYGLSVQVMTAATGMASVWVYAKYPVAGQLLSARNLPVLRAVLWPRIWLQLLTFVVLALAGIIVGPPLLQWIGSGKEMLPSRLLVLLAVLNGLDMQFAFWGTLLSLENRVPTLWPAVVTNVCSLALAFGLSKFTAMGISALVLAPLLTGLVFNLWYWPFAGARSLGTTWLRFMFSGPGSGVSGAATRDAELVLPHSGK